MAYDTNLKSAFQASHQAFQNILGEKFTIEGDATEYEAVFDEDNIRRPFKSDGLGIMEEFQSFSCYAVKSQFDSSYDFSATIGKRLTRQYEDTGTQVYRIVAIRNDRIGIQFELDEIDR